MFGDLAAIGPLDAAAVALYAALIVAVVLMLRPGTRSEHAVLAITHGLAEALLIV